MTGAAPPQFLNFWFVCEALMPLDITLLRVAYEFKVQPPTLGVRKLFEACLLFMMFIALEKLEFLLSKVWMSMVHSLFKADVHEGVFNLFPLTIVFIIFALLEV
jgi:hypothetical protein